jgi:hypothetical protein
MGLRSTFAPLLLLVVASAACSGSSSPPAVPDASGDAPAGGDQDASDASSASPDGASVPDDAMDAMIDAMSAADAATEAAAVAEAGLDASTELDASDAGIVDTGTADAGPEASTDAGLVPDVFLFDGMADGAVYGGRTGADDLCVAAAAKLADASFSLAHVHAFVSVSDLDEIRDMPSNYGVPTDRPVGSVSGNAVAADWRGLLGGTLLQSLNDAGIRTGGSGWYSGSNADGSVATTTTTDGGVHPYTCSGWTSVDGFLDGEYGLGGDTTSGWISVSRATCALGNYSLLCVGWN